MRFKYFKNLKIVKILYKCFDSKDISENHDDANCRCAFSKSAVILLQLSQKQANIPIKSGVKRGHLYTDSSKVGPTSLELKSKKFG